ncbi:squamosa promoter-binding-like protein 1 [Olea europaea var. sylvestris]|uniref:squamosa promoter-binding-like protein 1 n=1 Tax=Olea europaea var. sylvestris TaxID=158386 RepID=UPI000C1D392A|nr:squamosa promoter-binding-like protein 1 [Olea europaea var. sylvestris]
MEARIGSEAQLYYGLPSTDLRTVGKRRMEWDPNDWKWDGHLFVASRLNPNPSNYQGRQFFPLESGITTTRNSSNSSSSCSEDLNQGAEKEKRELEKRRKLVVVEDDNLADEGGNLMLNLGGQGYPMIERNTGNGDGTSGKKTKLAGAATNRAVCQVEDCKADLSKAKNYHRRHKVCEMHSKATRALVGNQMQRFCQQCSRFHALQEFDEGKRSCRRRLAGHNKRRRKSQSDNVNNNNPLNDNQASGYLLMTLLKILSNMHSNGSNHKDDQDMISHLLHSLASQKSLHGETSISGCPKESQDLLNYLPSLGNSEFLHALLSNSSQGQRPGEQVSTIPVDEMLTKDGNLQATNSQRPGVMLSNHGSSPVDAEGVVCSAGRSKLNNFDLNDVYVDTDDGMEVVERSHIPVDLGTDSIEFPSWVQESHQSSPPQTSGNSDSGSAQSPSSSNGDAQSRTDRIVFKLFGKEPSDFPIILRTQIFDWLSHSPTDMESYIRPGCIILTIYLRLSESAWEELCCDLASNLSRLLDFCHDVTFWSTGWIYVRVQNQIAFIYNGQVVVDTSLPFKSSNYSTILSVKPIAITSSERAQFVVKGFNLSRPSTRILCSLEGNYLEANSELVEHEGDLERHDVQHVNFACSIPAVNGRGFIEVEDHCLGRSFFPFLVAEDNVCSEMRMLEREIELTETDDFQLETAKLAARKKVLDFIHEMGWLLHRNNLKSRMGRSDPKSDCFPFKRFKYLVEFSIDRDWCAVLKKLLDILFNGTVGAGDQPLLKFALNEMGLLHRAVRRNSRSLVEMLLKYAPERVAEELSLQYNSLVESDGSFLFRPDVVGPAGLTPLHIAAGRDGSEDILDALTCDPGKVGIEAWKNAHDSPGFTPEDYARLRGHYSYIHLVQRKITKKVSSGHVVVDIPETCSDSGVKQKKNEGATTGFEIGMSKGSVPRPCGICNQELDYRSMSRTLRYKPAMLSMVAIAAVCVCVALLFKSSPEVLYVFRPFRWEMLEYGSS